MGRSSSNGYMLTWVKQQQGSFCGDSLLCGFMLIRNGGVLNAATEPEAPMPLNNHQEKSAIQLH